MVCGVIGALIGQFRWDGHIMTGAFLGGVVLGPLVGMEAWREWVRWRGTAGRDRR